MVDGINIYGFYCIYYFSEREVAFTEDFNFPNINTEYWFPVLLLLMKNKHCSD